MIALLAAATVACGGSGSSAPPEQRSAPLELLDAAPLLGVLLADCTERGTGTIDDSEGSLPDSPIRLFELPPAGSLFGGELEEFLVTLELHGDELPIVAGLTSSLEDPTLAIPLPLDRVLSLLPITGIPSDTPLFGMTNLGCDDAETAALLGLVPIFRGMQ